MTKLLVAIAAMFTLTIGAAQAAPVPLAGNVTVVDFEARSTLASVGITLSPRGDASRDGDIFTFPITGGELDFGAGLAGDIEHDDSGIALTSGISRVIARNFVIDTVTSELLAQVRFDNDITDGLGPITQFGGDSVAIATLDLSGLTAAQIIDIDNPAIPLVANAALLGVISSQLGVDLSGAAPVMLGFAATDPRAVPLPGALAFFAAGAGALAAARRPRKRSASAKA